MFQDCGLDESYTSCDELTDSTSVSHNESHIIHENVYTVTQPARPSSLSTAQYKTQHSHNAQPVYARVHKHNDPIQPSPDPWAGRGRSALPGPPSSLAEQLKQVLAERERRMTDGNSRESSGDYSDLNKQNTALVTQHLVEEIRQAVNEANARVKKVLPVTLSPPGSIPWQRETSTPPSPSSLSSGSLSPTRHDTSWTPPHPSDLSLSSSSICSVSVDKRGSHIWHNAPVSEWTKEQVCQWLLALGLEQHIACFLEHQVGGVALLQLDSRDFKILGVTGDDKNRLKRKLKELKLQVEKERRQVEKERKEREKLQRKHEKLQEKLKKK